jgi:molybdate transport system substrate-binding protein
LTTGRLRFLIGLTAIALTSILARSADAGEVKVAVAANFTEAVKEIAALFEKATGDKVVFSFGSSGQLYAQITRNAPFEVFLSADQERPEKAEKEGYAVPGSRFTYATGRIVLFGIDKQTVHGEATLKDAKFAKLAICNPVTAPYGAASVEAMKALGVYDALKDRLVQGENISQAYQFVATGNAEVGFVALSQIARDPDKGSRWIVPSNLYKPIAQDAVLLKHGADNPAAKAFVAFLKGKEAHAVIEKFGYGTGG